MDFVALAHGLSHALSALSLDDSSVSALAMLGGIVGGWTITSMFQPRKAPARRKNDPDRK